MNKIRNNNVILECQSLFFFAVTAIIPTLDMLYTRTTRLLNFAALFLLSLS